MSVIRKYLQYSMCFILGRVTKSKVSKTFAGIREKRPEKFRFTIRNLQATKCNIFILRQDDSDYRVCTNSSIRTFETNYPIIFMSYSERFSFFFSYNIYAISNRFLFDFSCRSKVELIGILFVFVFHFSIKTEARGLGFRFRF